MDDPAKTKPEEKPIIWTQPRKRHMPPWLKVLVWIVVGGVGLVCAYFAFVIIEIIVGITTISNKCQDSQNKATQASQQYADELNNLGLFTQPYAKAQPSPSGDCIDTSAHTADATLSKIYQTPEPYPLLIGEINSGLVSNGFKQTSAPALQAIKDPTNPIDVDATYSKPGLPDLSVTYIIGHSPNVCGQYTQNYATQDSAAYDTCVSEYEASFTNLSVQNVSEVDLDMTKDFPNNY